MTGTLDGLGQLTLMHGAGTGHSAGQDLASVRNILAQLGSILIIDVLDLVGTELADLSAASVVSGTLGALRTLSTLGALGSFFCLHELSVVAISVVGETGPL